MKDIGPYELLSRISSGGMGEIYIARLQREGGFEKRVAVKRILPHLAQDETFIRMFESEARLSALLNHQNIVQVFDFGRDDGEAWIAMEYVEGVDLRRLLDSSDGGGLPLGLALSIAQKCARALDYAHRREGADGEPLRIIHRDVSPQNVLVSFEGDVKLTDFGLAKACSLDTWSMSGMLKGKLAYMAPEQVTGRTVDTRSDIFAMGLLLYELLCGQRCYPPNTPITELMDLARHARYQSLNTVDDDIPDAVCDVVAKCLSLDPDDRFQTAGELELALRAVERSHKLDGSVPTLVNHLKPLADLQRRQRVLEDETTRVSANPIAANALLDTVAAQSTDAVFSSGQKVIAQAVTSNAPVSSELIASVESSGTKTVEKEPSARQQLPRWSFGLLLGICVVMGIWWAVASMSSIDTRVGSSSIEIRSAVSEHRHHRRVLESDLPAYLKFVGVPDGAVCFVRSILNKKSVQLNDCSEKTLLAPGPYQLAVTSERHAPWSSAKTVILTAGQTQTIRVSMVTAPIQSCSFKIATTPPGVTVEVDGAVQSGTTPLVLSNVAPGVRKLVLKRSGHRTVSKTVTCDDQTPDTFTFELSSARFRVKLGGRTRVLRPGMSHTVRKKYGTTTVVVRFRATLHGGIVTVNANPYVQVRVNGASRGNTPSRNIKIRIGKSYRLAFSRSGKTVGSLSLKMTNDRPK